MPKKVMIKSQRQFMYGSNFYESDVSLNWISIVEKQLMYGSNFYESDVK